MQIRSRLFGRLETAACRPGFLCLLAVPVLLVPVSAPADIAVDSVGITVRDLDRATSFYQDVLGFTTVGEWELAGSDIEHALGVFGTRLRIARLKLGDESIELMQFLAPRGRPMPVDTRSNDLWFQHIAIIVSDIDRAYAQLRGHGVEHASSGPQTLPDWNPNAGGISAFYFRDPDGNFLEILEFPADKGLAKWHEPTSRLFLGVDHTAIVVSDTEASLAFYRDTLGMQVVGHAENYGVEQEHLNNVFGARLRITALRADQGFGVELLEYLAPRSGRPMPVDTASSDLWHWQINYSTDAVEALDRRFRQGDYRYISSGVVSVDDAPYEGEGARPPAGLIAMVRDPDGHASSFLQTVSGR